MLTDNRRWLTVVVMVAILGLVAVAMIGCEDEQGKVEPADKTTTRDTERDNGQPGDKPPKFDERTEAAQATEGEIIPVDQASFDAEVLQADMPVFVDFYADWCGPCRALHPTIEELATDYAGRVKFVQVDVDENGGLARDYGVQGIPALFVIDGGEVVDQTVGLQGKADLAAMLDKHVG